MTRNAIHRHWLQRQEPASSPDPSIGCCPIRPQINVDMPRSCTCSPGCWPLLFWTDCSICSDGYTAQLGFSCNECSENNSRGIAVAVVLVVAVVIAAVSMISYVMSGEAGLGAGQGVIDCLTRYIPLQSVKIVIVAWQILTQVSRWWLSLKR